MRKIDVDALTDKTTEDVTMDSQQKDKAKEFSTAWNYIMLFIMVTD